MVKHLGTAAILLTVGLIAGCGSSGSMTASTSTGKSAIAGTVADGYLVDATVFLDKNRNYQLDAGEPTATTDQNGAYSLSVDPADVGAYPIVAIAIKGVTKDLDTNTFVNNSYVLSLPAAAINGTVSAFISPMSTQVRELMETGQYSSMQQAMEELRTQLNMPVGTNMLADYMLANNTTMHTAAQNMASLMGSQMAQVLDTSGSIPTVDVNRYRGMMGTIFSNISSVKGSNTQSAMSNLMGTMMANLPSIAQGQPFRNMSTAFRGGMMRGNSTTGGMM